MKVTLLEKYQGEATRVTGKTEVKPWYPTETFNFWIELAETVSGTIGFGFSVPIDKIPSQHSLNKESLKQIIEKWGSRRLQEIIDQHNAKQKENQQETKRQSYLDAIATTMNELLKD